MEGHDIRRDMPAIYSLMGVCPQARCQACGGWQRCPVVAAAAPPLLAAAPPARCPASPLTCPSLPAPSPLPLLCPPQDNLLWDRLTAREHLRFYGRLKNLRGGELAAAVDDALRAVNLFHGGVGDKQARAAWGGVGWRAGAAPGVPGSFARPTGRKPSPLPRSA